MKVFVVLIAAIASVNSGTVRIVSQGGWTPTEPPTTQGWSTPPPTTGWPSSTVPPTTQGWSSSTTTGWGAPPSLTNIDLEGALAAEASGWAAQNHAEDVQVIGGGGWGGPPADIVISASGQSVVGQSGSLLQVTDQDSETASSLNNISVSQIAEASEGALINALGLEISSAQSGWAGAAGEAASAAEGTSSLTVNQAASNLGIALP